jgi:hypothetical protein
MMSYINIQVYEDGKPISHPFNKCVEERDEVADDKARVKYSTGMTINIGNYQTARVDVGIELPSEIDKLEETYNKALDFVNTHLMEEIGAMQALKKSL